MAAADTTAAFRAAVERADIEGTVATVTPDVIVNSPITDLSRFEGVDEFRALLEHVYVTITDIRYTDDVGDETIRALFYTGRVGGVHVDEATKVRLNDDGLIEEIWLYFRPLPGLVAVTAGLGIQLGRRQGRLNGVLMTLLLRALPAVMRLGDRVAIPLAGLPSRPKRR